MIEVLAVRGQWCRPGEPVLWCHRTQLSCGFDVVGLDARGKPKKGFGARAMLAGGDKAAGVVAGLAEAAAGASGGSDFSDPPANVVFGGGEDCAAVEQLSRVPGDALVGCWVLTPQRFAWLTFSAEQREEEPSPQGLLGGALRFGKGAVKFAQELAANKAEHEPGVPVPVPQVRTWLEIERSAITEISAQRRDLGRGFKYKPWYLRVTLTDGSGVDVCRTREQERVQRLLDMSHGKI
ncbi:hypothetical protein [Saccharopolyspora flava]|uniref:Uncharacterized protein n=1 Tax=Saccharopolyspora flava TaxID=95161 RepID=A0A1I6UZB3_9PSEU|nr:hypothetical protein [Saccharopolyspora flava]SFT06677.1 hypothetical protein SAMN05660874_05408 [Saccharopolyspora flava]